MKKKHPTAETSFQSICLLIDIFFHIYFTNLFVNSTLLDTLLLYLAYRLQNKLG